MSFSFFFCHGTIVDFSEFVTKVRKGTNPPEVLIAVDPGETTGYAVFIDTRLDHYAQVSADDIWGAAKWLETFIKKYNPKVVVVEDYRVYSWRAKQHTWSDLFNPRLIGGREVLFGMHDVPLIKQQPQVAKGFCTDDKLKSWGFWMKGQPHVRDAIRHGCYYILFNKQT